MTVDPKMFSVFPKNLLSVDICLTFTSSLRVTRKERCCTNFGVMISADQTFDFYLLMYHKRVL